MFLGLKERFALWSSNGILWILIHNLFFFFSISEFKITIFFIFRSYSKSYTFFFIHIIFTFILLLNVLVALWR